ncbi:undecaprenol kinase [Sorangium cellulosum]|uniref:Undecaprenyl-diphosphatase n=1 Tax=Sorangium cellulosum TaxID=56 RepID=A0A2L0FBP0_SORCE|nr:undecaprenol kinase [Sorangium cellulosum]
MDVAVLAAVQGAAQALPISATGHGAAARVWLGAASFGAWLDAAQDLAAAAAIALAVRRRLLAALGEGLRAALRPSLFRDSPPARDAALLAAAAAASLVVAALVRPAGAAAAAPLAAGLGLLATGAALASTALAPPRAAADAPSLAGMIAAGAAHGLAALPGGSRVGAALVVLLWLGVRPARAVELALALGLPALLASGLAGVVAPHGPAPAAGAAALGLLAAALSAAAGAAALRALAERRRTGALALWVVPLGLAMAAYARALPGPA